MYRCTKKQEYHSQFCVFTNMSIYQCVYTKYEKDLSFISGYFPFGGAICAFWVTMDVLMCTASIWHMCTMSMDRYFTLKYPMQYGRNKTRTMVALKILFVWGVSIAISSPICIYGFIDHTTVLNDFLCVPTLSEFIIYGSIFAFYIPLFIMIITYLLTIKILVKNQSLMRTIERSDIRLRPRHRTSLAKTCQVATFVSPPSSESRKESQIVTEVSSIGRTPNRERVKLPGFENFGVPRYEPKPQTDSPNTDIQLTSLDDLSDHEKPSEDNNNTANTCNPISINIVPDVRESLSDTENDENTCLLKSREIPTIVTTSQPSSPVSKVRNRTNTEFLNNFPTTHSSLKIPKSSPNLQASVSCSNFSRDCATELGLFNSKPNSGGGLNRDYKSVEWSHNFYQIQAEMDQCLLESQREKKQENIKNMTTEFSELKASLKSPDYLENDSNQMDKLKPDMLTANLSESGDSTDDLDSSSDNTSDLITIKLYPKSVYMYKLDIPKKSSKTNSPVKSPVKSPKRIPNGHLEKMSATSNEISSSLSSDKMHQIRRRIRSRKRSSFTAFIKNVRKNHNFMTKKATTNEKKASKVLGIIFAVFVVLWTPFFIANILSAICPTCISNLNPEVLSAFLWMGYVASLANPIIYTMFNTAFRRTFVKILTCKMCKKEYSTRIHRSSYPSHPASAASIYTDRRQTVTMLVNNNADSRRQSDYLSTNGIHKQY